MIRLANSTHIEVGMASACGKFPPFDMGAVANTVTINPLTRKRTPNPTNIQAKISRDFMVELYQKHKIGSSLREVKQLR